MHDRKITIDIVLTVEGEDPITVRASPTEEHLCLPFHDFAVRYLEMPIMVLKQRIGIDPETGMADLMLRRSAPPAVAGGDAPPEIQVGDAVTVEDDLGLRYEHRVETEADAKVPDGYRAVRIRRVIWRRRQEG